MNNRYSAQKDNFLKIDDSFDLKINEVDSRHLPLFDAVYIPTLGKRKHLTSVIAQLINHTHKIYILINSDPPFWILNLLSESTHVITNFDPIERNPITDRASAQNPSVQYLDNYDIPMKRSFALSHSKSKGFSKIGLVDDDMVFTERHLFSARQLIAEGYDMVGFYVFDYPDVSTMEHVSRMINGTPSNISIGGNFLFFNSQKTSGFFPYIYNEDWIFLLYNRHKNLKICSGGEVGQLSHEPWKDSKRIQFEQFGDIIIYGLRKLIISDSIFFEFNELFWRSIHAEHLNWLDGMNKEKNNALYKNAIAMALAATKSIKVEDIVNFIKALKEEFNYV